MDRQFKAKAGVPWKLYFLLLTLAAAGALGLLPSIPVVFAGVLQSTGMPLPRLAERMCFALKLQPPPRCTRLEPLLRPLGSVTLPDGYSPYQSSHHSHTLPCIS